MAAAGRKKREALEEIYGEQENNNLRLDYHMDAEEVVRRIKRQGKDIENLLRQ